MGDNGAGKSTLVKIIAGNFHATHGVIRFGGQEHRFDQPRDARNVGIEVVYQDLALANNVSAAANVFLGRELTRRVGPFRFLDHKAMNTRALELFGELKSETRPRDLVKSMSGGQRQAVAIARTRLSNAKLILMDEPTAAISVRQVAEVLDLIRRLRDQGRRGDADFASYAGRVFRLRPGRGVAARREAGRQADRQVEPRRSHRPHHRRNRIRLKENRMSQNTAGSLSFTNVGKAKWWRNGVFASQTAYVAIAFIVITALVSVFAHNFLSYGNLLNTSKNFSYIAIVALGSTLVIITGGIDLSVGSVIALTAVMTAMLMKMLAATAIAGIPYAVMTLSVLGALAVAAIAGLVNGLLISRIGLSPFVTTLGTLSVCRGITYVITQGRGQAPAGPDVNTFYSLTDGKLFGLPVPLVYLLVLALIMGIALRHSRWGRYVFVLGGNEKAAALTGVSVTRVKISVYVLCALSAGFAGVLITGWLGSAPANLATGYELKIIAASVIGGADLAGGVGGPVGAIIGAALIEVIRNGLALFGADTYWEQVFVGTIIILAVLVDRIRTREAE